MFGPGVATAKWNRHGMLADVFGFFVSGGDLPGTANLASVGGDNTAVNNVNGGTIGNQQEAGVPCEMTNTGSFVQNYNLQRAQRAQRAQNNQHHHQHHHQHHQASMQEVSPLFQLSMTTSKTSRGFPK